jgi:hypothetical protein
MESTMLAKLFDFLADKEYEYNAEQKVHPMTLKKYFRDLLGVGSEQAELEAGRKAGAFLKPEDVADFASVFQLFTTKVK